MSIYLFIYLSIHLSQNLSRKSNFEVYEFKAESISYSKVLLEFLLRSLSQFVSTTPSQIHPPKRNFPTHGWETEENSPTPKCSEKNKSPNLGIGSVFFLGGLDPTKSMKCFFWNYFCAGPKNIFLVEWLYRLGGGFWFLFSYFYLIPKLKKCPFWRIFSGWFCKTKKKPVVQKSDDFLHPATGLDAKFNRLERWVIALEPMSLELIRRRWKCRGSGRGSWLEGLANLFLKKTRTV